MNFTEWLAQLDEVFKAHHFQHGIGAGNEEAWREYFEDDYSPEEAFLEDFQA